MKQMIRKEVGGLHAHEFTPLELIDKIKSLIELYGDTLYFECEDVGNGSSYTAIMIKVLENDSQYEGRLRHEAQIINKREKNEREIYATLKAKFEN
jgi:hypothetical protein